jgi:hypothetical protein
MNVPSVADLIPVLQTAIGPMILISGVGLLLLSMTNRLGRIIDRARILAREMREGAPSGDATAAAQLAILWRRAQLIRVAIALAAMSALAAAVLIITIFFTALWQIETAWLIGTLFIACMACLIGSLVTFIHDVNRSLAALKLEIKEKGSGLKDPAR